MPGRPPTPLERYEKRFHFMKHAVSLAEQFFKDSLRNLRETDRADVPQTLKTAAAVFHAAAGAYKASVIEEWESEP